tara:strand:+ start:117 stop:314 length:198 start_codon:yes stop_codon:yes gene_type:complete
MNRVSETDIIGTLRNWTVEVESGRNDGWTKYHYLDKLMKVKEYVDEHLAKYEAVQQGRLSNNKTS